MIVTGTKHIETGVDRLLDLVNERHELSLSQAVIVLNVQRAIINHWCDTLEEEGLIHTNRTINERYILSKQFFHSKGGRRRSAVQIFKGIYRRKQKPTMDALTKKEQELKTMTKNVHEQVQKLKGYEKLKTDAELKHKELKRNLRRYDQEKRLFDQQINELESIRAFLKKKSDELEVRENQVS